MKRDKEDLSYALTDEGKEIHASQSESGLNGYYCLGCKGPLQAVHRKVPRVYYYFRHHLKDIDRDLNQCVVANNEYRERLAEQILQRLKYVNVPPVLKFNQNNLDDPPMILDLKKRIDAFKIRSQISIYEDENGNIKWGKNPEIKEKFLFVRPDVTFFNEKDDPILLVEFVFTHKISDEKKAKLNRLGINTVQIILPKSSEEEIEAAMIKSTKYKWVYNEKEANTNYTQVPGGNYQSVSEIDELQRALLQESFKCKSAEIKQLILSIRKCLGSKYYKESVSGFRREIQRVENNISRDRERLEQLEEAAETEVRFEYSDSISKLEYEENKFEHRTKDLEERYRTKRDELESKTKRVNQEQREVEASIDRERRSDNIEEHIRNKFDKEIEYVKEIIKINRATENRLRESVSTVEKEFNDLEREELENFRREQERYSEQTKKIEQRIEQVIRDQKKRNVGGSADFERKRKRLFERIMQRDLSAGDELAKRIQYVLEAGRISFDIPNQRKDLQRYNKAYIIAKGLPWNS